MDDAYVMSLRRANLDAMNGKSRRTIASHRTRSVEIVNNAIRINKTPTIQPRGPFLMEDQVGMGLQVDMLQKSLVANGRIEKFVQAETLRQLKSTYTKNWDSSPRGVSEGAAFARGTGRVRPTACPTQSEWNYDSWRGLESRMGHKSKANHALSMGAMVQTITFIKEDARHAESQEEANYLWKVGAFLTICTVASLRGYEGFYTELAALRKYQHVGQGGSVPTRMTKSTILSEEQCMALPHVVIPLLGKFKGEIGIDHHIINVASETMSGLQPRWWVDKLVEVADMEGRIAGPVFATPGGKLAVSADYDATFRTYLHKVKAETNHIPFEMDVDAMFGISRTPRKTAASRAKRAGYADKLEEMNRWRKVEIAANRRVRQMMSALYSEAVLLMPVTWRVSYAL